MVFSGTIASADEVRELAALGVAGYVNEYTAVQHIVPALAPHLFPDTTTAARARAWCSAFRSSYRFGNTIAAALTLNISRGGLAIRTTSPLDVGTASRCASGCPAAKKDIDAEARVAWADRRVGMGLQFTKLDAGRSGRASTTSSRRISSRTARA